MAMIPMRVKFRRNFPHKESSHVKIHKLWFIYHTQHWIIAGVTNRFLKIPKLLNNQRQK